MSKCELKSKIYDENSKRMCEFEIVKPDSEKRRRPQVTKEADFISNPQ